MSEESHRPHDADSVKLCPDCDGWGGWYSDDEFGNVKDVYVSCKKCGGNGCFPTCKRHKRLEHAPQRKVQP